MESMLTVIKHAASGSVLPDSLTRQHWNPQGCFAADISVLTRWVLNSSRAELSQAHVHMVRTGPGRGVAAN